MKIRLFALAFLALAAPAIFESEAADFKAGAAIVDITPPAYPVLVNAMFTERSASQTVDPLNVRALVLDDGSTRLAIAVVDTCMIPRDLIDRAKAQASAATQIPAARMLVSATHTHSAPSAMGCLGSRADTNYAAFLPGKIADAIIAANARLVPAQIGWGVTNDWEHTFNRRWIRRPDRMQDDPFGERTVRAMMHPGHESPDVTGPSGPVDPALTVLALRTKEGRPLALLANYSQHYYGSPLLSSDYYGRFAGHVARLLDAEGTSCVGIMSQGTSGDLMWMDYGAPARDIGYDAYAREMAERVRAVYDGIQFRDSAPLKMAERKLRLGYRTPSPERLDWARAAAAKVGDRVPQKLPEIYALEAIYLHERPETELILQALGIGDLGIAALPNEVFALTGLKLKARSPFPLTLNIELANGAEGYIPPPEQHFLGGYTTWPARTAGLEIGAEPRIAETLVSMLAEIAGQAPRKLEAARGIYADSVLASKPIAYWRLEEMEVSTAFDATGNQNSARYENGIALYLPGVGSGEGISPRPQLSPSNFSSPGGINRAVHFAGGRLKANLPKIGESYSAEFWFWNGLDNVARPITGYLFSRGNNHDLQANGDHLGIGGSHQLEAMGKLIFFNGNRLNRTLIGRTVLQPKTWHHLVISREQKKASVYLDGANEPEISGEIESSVAGSAELFIAGRNDNFANFEGKIDEVAIYDRVLQPEEAAAHFKAAGLPAVAKAILTATPARSPEESLKKIHVADGFRVDLVAAEPLVLDPVAIDWDAAGRLWVVEMADYPLGIDNRGKPGGRVRVLEDSDNDGNYDKSTLFADGLRFPTGLLTWRDGVLVTAAPEILFLRDTDGDGRANEREVLFSGFLEGNQQLRINGLRWGLDNWVYCAVGGHYRGYGSETKIKSLLTGKEIPLGSRDFRFRPDTGEFEPESGPSQFGRNRDEWGRWFGTQNSNPLWHYVLSDRYIRRNPHVPAPDPVQQVMVPRNPKIFPASAQEKRYHSFNEAGHFTSGCSGMVYGDDLLFPRGAGPQAFACEPFHNLVHRETLSDEGVSFTARRAAGEQTREFFASEDRWCRPVMTRTGPDGALWVVDMYRYMIEHPDWLPDAGKSELLPNYRQGDDKGRIYRIVPVKGERRIPPRLDKASGKDLIQALDSSNSWQRDKVQQLILWKKDLSLVPDLEVLARSPNPLARLQALWTLEGLNALRAEVVLAALQDDEPPVRENALLLAESHSTPAIVAAAGRLVDDSDPKVRLQLACTLGEWTNSPAGEALARLALRDYSDAFIRAAIMTSAIPHAGPLVEALVKENGPALRAFSEPLQMLALAVHHREWLARLLEPILHPEGEDFTTDQMDSYGQFMRLLQRHSTSVEELARASSDDLSARLKSAGHLISYAQNAAKEKSERPEESLAAARLLARNAATMSEGIDHLSSWLDPRESIDMQRKVIAALGEIGDARVPEVLLRNWPAYGPEIRNTVIDALLGREAWTIALLQAVESGQAPARAFDATRRARLTRHNSARVRQLSATLFTDSSSMGRAPVVEKYRTALDLSPKLANGAEVFGRACQVCHKREGKGNDVGPDLNSVVEHTPEKLLVNILDPNADIQPGYTAYTCTLASGEELYGVISAETANSVILKLADGSSRTVLRAEIASLRSSNLSLMPEGLEATLSAQDLADLIGYLRSPVRESL